MDECDYGNKNKQIIPRLSKSLCTIVCMASTLSHKLNNDGAEIAVYCKYYVHACCLIRCSSKSFDHMVVNFYLRPCWNFVL